MNTLRARTGQLWPRITVGLLSSIHLLRDFALLFIAVRVDSFSKFHQYSSGLTPEEQDKVVRGILIFGAAICAAIDFTALYAALRKSITATKASLAFWCFQMASAILSISLVVLVLFLSEETRRNLPEFSAFTSLHFFLNTAVQLFYGWALLVMLRDARGQSRNEWGRLTRPDEKGVFEEAGPVSPTGEGYIRI
ncbi:hypothetical protein EDD21DRAFT_372025 [Dissophora ornata]|nr:hypothetical protein BGZ58_010455 [Dissophora ornata]KAI8602382.1 hypothetical protein EDD21DRAFT_372025 [Dissophora ornata]